MRLSILVPFRDVDGTRTSAMEWVTERWRAHYPGAQLIVAPDDGADPFNKSMAVNAAAKNAKGKLLAILDADSWVDPAMVKLGLGMIEKGAAPWVIPCDVSWRLTPEATARLMAGTRVLDTLPELTLKDCEWVSGVTGFLHLVSRAGFDEVGGMDERFRGWGGEDQAFTKAMDAVVGTHATLGATVISLWHARPVRAGLRTWVGQNRTFDSVKGPLLSRYHAARGNKEKMLHVLRDEWVPPAPSDSDEEPIKFFGGADRPGPGTFRTTKYPGLMARAGRYSFKFVAGQIYVGDPIAADAFRGFVARSPMYAITEDASF